MRVHVSYDHYEHKPAHIHVDIAHLHLLERMVFSVRPVQDKYVTLRSSVVVIRLWKASWMWFGRLLNHSEKSSLVWLREFVMVKGVPSLHARFTNMEFYGRTYLHKFQFQLMMQIYLM